MRKQSASMYEKIFVPETSTVGFFNPVDEDEAALT